MNDDRKGPESNSKREKGRNISSTGLETISLPQDQATGDRLPSPASDVRVVILGHISLL